MSPHDSLLEQLTAALQALPAEAYTKPIARAALQRIHNNVTMARVRGSHPLAPELLREALGWAEALKTSTSNQEVHSQSGKPACASEP